MNTMTKFKKQFNECFDIINELFTMNICKKLNKKSYNIENYDGVKYKSITFNPGIFDRLYEAPAKGVHTPVNIVVLVDYKSNKFLKSVDEDLLKTLYKIHGYDVYNPPIDDIVIDNINYKFKNTFIPYTIYTDIINNKKDILFIYYSELSNRFADVYYNNILYTMISSKDLII